MSEDLRQRAITAVSNILETMFYISAEPQEPPRGPHSSEDGKANAVLEGGETSSLGDIRSEIRVQGKWAGQILFCLPYQLARRLTANFLGVEEGNVSEDQILDGAGEFTNMVAGNLFSGHQSEDSQFTIPHVGRVAPRDLEMSRPESETGVDFHVEDQIISLKFQVSRTLRDESRF